MTCQEDWIARTKLNLICNALSESLILFCALLTKMIDHLLRLLISGFRIDWLMRWGVMLLGIETSDLPEKIDASPPRLSLKLSIRFASRGFEKLCTRLRSATRMQQQGQNPLSIAIPKPPQEPPEKLRIHTILPPQDPHFTEAIEDFLCLFSDADLKREPYIREYVSEELARWGRWTHRGRAPAACFEAACSGAQRHLEKIGHLPTECTSRVDATLAKALAGMIVNAVEPDAVRPCLRPFAKIQKNSHRYCTDGRTNSRESHTNCCG